MPFQPTKTQNIDHINIQAVIDKVDLVTLVLEYGIDLEPQSNGDYICFCPFHDDVATKSMHIYTKTNSFHCFGCHAGASIFEFVMQMEGIEFKAALMKLAGRAGYNGGCELRDLNIKSHDDSFYDIREKIEIKCTKAARGVYNKLRPIYELRKLYDGFEQLWKWYDKNQQIFDKKLFCGTNSVELSVKLYEFYEVFLKKLEELESNL